MFLINYNFASIGLNGWEKWSYAATIAGAIINAGFLAALLWQIRVGQAALREAKRATDTSDKALKETEHTRIDTQAPRVSAFLNEPMIHGLKSAKDGSFSMQSEPEYVLPRMKNDRLYILIEGEFVNEGKTTARVHMTNTARFETGELEADDMLAIPIPTANQEYLLKPGHSVRFSWSESHTLEEWADAFNNPSPPNPHSACFMEIIVSDAFAEGVVDHIYLEASGRPIEPIEGDKGHWKLGKAGSLAAISYPIIRTYRHEGQDGLEPSWIPVYKEWGEQQNTKQK